MKAAAAIPAQAPMSNPPPLPEQAAASHQQNDALTPLQTSVESVPPADPHPSPVTPPLDHSGYWPPPPSTLPPNHQSHAPTVPASARQPHAAPADSRPSAHCEPTTSRPPPEHGQNEISAAAPQRFPAHATTAAPLYDAHHALAATAPRHHLSPADDKKQHPQFAAAAGSPPDPKTSFSPPSAASQTHQTQAASTDRCPRPAIR